MAEGWRRALAWCYRLPAEGYRVLVWCYRLPAEGYRAQARCYRPRVACRGPQAPSSASGVTYDERQGHLASLVAFSGMASA